ncbi:MAG: acetyltransferase [Gammaproteobacteria bacterium]|nr:acetyltransferase [Gammaproteobacteria bacterium]MDH5801642.1 acetyltransferase [Gammaproteobacteria bacterium]
MHITLRDATIDDLKLLQQWDKQVHVIAADPNDDWHWETELQRSPPWRQQLIALAHGRPVGFVQIIDPAKEDNHYWGDIAPGFRAVDIWLGDIKDTGRGLGSVIMRMVINRCFSDAAVSSILVDPLSSNTKAHRFYKRLGFVFKEQRNFGQDLCHVYHLQRTDLKI